MLRTRNRNTATEVANLSNQTSEGVGGRLDVHAVRYCCSRHASSDAMHLPAFCRMHRYASARTFESHRWSPLTPSAAACLAVVHSLSNDSIIIRCLKGASSSIGRVPFALYGGNTNSAPGRRRPATGDRHSSVPPAGASHGRIHLPPLL
jgi:hypothetical protein